MTANIRQGRRSEGLKIMDSWQKSEFTRARGRRNCKLDHVEKKGGNLPRFTWICPVDSRMVLEHYGEYEETRKTLSISSRKTFDIHH